MNSQDSSRDSVPHDLGFSPWQRLKTKRISYLTLPLIVMATVVEIVILATGRKYQQLVCLPQGMGVTFFGIGPIGATILAVELLKLPLAIWTASRHGWRKYLMICVGLPLICVLTFQLVKDMAVYEMSVAMAPATQALDKATAEEVRITQLTGELAAIESKKTDREHKLADLSAKQAKSKADLAESIKRNEDARQDAIALTEYQKKELSEVQSREAALIQQFNSDTEQLNKSLTDLRARRETELARDSKWNAEEARIENAYKAKLSDYTNKKTAYDKDKADYDSASFLRKPLMKVPVDPGVPPVREANTLLKSAELTDIESQIKAKEGELLAVNTKRRDSVAQVEAEARHLRDQYDQRSSTKREEADRKREELSAAQTALATEWKTEQKGIDQELSSAVQKVDGIRAELDAARKRAEGYYEEREADIRKTQVHRIATTVEIVRGLIRGERPMSIKATAKERGDILTDQISMVRIWVYPVLAFIVAFLPTLMVEIGFSTMFEPEQQRPPYRLGLFGRRLHWLYIRAGRFKILRAERLASEATAQIVARDRALASANANTDKAVASATADANQALAEKELELQDARETINTAAARYDEKLAKRENEYAAQLKARDEELAATEQEHAEQLKARDEKLATTDEKHAAVLKKKEEEWVAKFAGMADSLNRTVIEKDALRDLQKSEIDRQIQMRQNAWADRITQLREELDSQRAASEADRTSMMQEHRKKLLEVAEDAKNQIIQARRQASDAELAAAEASARLANDLKEAAQARDAAEAQLQQQSDSFGLKLEQAKADAAREIDKATRQEKSRWERQHAEMEKTLRQRQEDFEHQLKQREQEFSLAADSRVSDEQTRIEQETRRREAELERQFAARALELEARWKQEILHREETAQAKLKQQEQQLQAQAEARSNELQRQAEQEFSRRELDLKRQLETQAREAEARLKQELHQKELAFQAKLKQRDQDLAANANARETELQNQLALELRMREEEWERKADARVRSVEARFGQEAQQKEELFLSRSRQRDQQWQVKLDNARAEIEFETEEVVRRRDAEADASRRELESELRREMQQKEESAQSRIKQREEEIVVQLTAQAAARQKAAQAQWETEVEKKTRTAVETFKALLARTEKERDEALQAASEGGRKLQNLERKLTEASSFFNGWKNGDGNGNGKVVETE